MRIISRAEWGARHGRGNDASSNLPWGEVVIHTEAGAVRPTGASLSTETGWVRGIERYHAVTLGWTGVGYSFLIAPSGRIFEGRGWGRSGAHTETRNSTAAGVCFIGHGDKQRATEAQWRSAAWLISEGVRLRCLRSDSKISGHRNYSQKGKSCPGDLIYPHIGRLRGITGRTTTTPAPAPKPKQPSGDPVLRRGDTGAAVRAWQEHRLVPLGEMTSTPVDGIFGSATEAATRRVQERGRVTVDGVVGPATRGAARRLLEGQKRQKPASSPTSEKDWFTMATEAQLKKIISDAVGPTAAMAMRGQAAAEKAARDARDAKAFALRAQAAGQRAEAQARAAAMLGLQQQQRQAAADEKGGHVDDRVRALVLLATQQQSRQGDADVTLDEVHESVEQLLVKAEACDDHATEVLDQPPGQ